MPPTVHDTRAMISGMTPVLEADTYVFCTTDDPTRAAAAQPKALAVFKEREGLSMILERGIAESVGFETTLPMRRITLEVFSALDGVGLTAAVSTALGAANIPCNIVSAYHHDHIFVPSHMAETALAILQDLQRKAATP